CYLCTPLQQEALGRSRDRKTFFGLVLGKRQKNRLPLQPGFEREPGPGNRKRRKALNTFSSRVLGKSKKGVTFAPRFNRKRAELKNELLSTGASKKSFSKRLATSEKLLTFATRFDRKGARNTNTAPLASGPR
ncbi:hypothetical protein, partial [Hymenobacter metallilatus]|uniref:hypothetical protein n=1 Tax=Hymenobacter metallilatus TaxID=2493666 RepID=UPI001C8B6DF9